MLSLNAVLGKRQLDDHKMSENLTPYTTLGGKRLTYGITWEGRFMNGDEIERSAPVGVLEGEGGRTKQITYKEDIDRQIKFSEQKLKDLTRMKELLDRNPDMQELLTLMSQTNLKRLY